MQVQIKYMYICINPCIDDTTNEFINVNFYICGDSDPATAAAVADLTKNFEAREVGLLILGQ